MRPLSLELEGFTAYKELSTVHFEGLQLVVLSGPNGSGKSSLLEAVIFALFGMAPRMKGKQSKEFISHGRDQFRISFQFQVEGQVYRVQRRYFRKGQPQVRLELKDGERWKVLTDKVEDTNKTITRLLRMGYDTFTKAVILPQNLFDQFLKGDKEKRREVLQEILSLDLFEKVSVLAGERSRALKAQIQMLEQSFAEKSNFASPENLQKFRGLLDGFEKEISEHLEQRQQLEKELGHFQSLKDAIAQHERRSRELTELQSKMKGLDDRIKREEISLESLRARRHDHELRLQAAASSREALQKFEERYQLFQDNLPALSQLRNLNQEVGKRQMEISNAEKEGEAIRKELEPIQHQMEAAKFEIDKRRQENETLRTARHVFELQSKLVAGEECPVCKQEVHEVVASSEPKESLHDLAPQEKIYHQLVEKNARMLERSATATRLLSGAALQLEKIQLECENLVKELSIKLHLQAKDLLAEAAKEYKTLQENQKQFRDAGTLEQNLRNQLHELDKEFQQKTGDLRLLLQEKTHYEQASNSFLVEIKECEIKIRAAGLDQTLDLSKSLHLAQNRMREADEKVAALHTECGKLKQQIENVHRAGEEAKQLSDQKDGLKKVESLYATLQQDLQKNRLPDFLLSTVLDTILEMASKKFFDLSQERYRLSLEGTGEIQVLDGWNADDPRPASSLSGGESFVASLAIALALSDYLQGRQHVQALFIDEGFGNLDRETRDKVAEVLASLQSEEKLIGVVTHLEDLAELFRDRIHVEKRPEGSHILQDFPQVLPEPLQKQPLLLAEPVSR